MDASKKAYHSACKEEKLAVSREANSKADPALNPEQLKKLQDKMDKCKQDVFKVNRMYYLGHTACTRSNACKANFYSIMSIKMAKFLSEGWV